ncbi:VOC family protein [Paenibacillus sp. GCM10012303]|uniref:VOC family protein n=1 Tax=Paenibacillus sp. GCM10012303 TaxID=3317340 RepID=UPI00360F1FEB
MESGNYSPKGYQSVTPYFHVRDAGKLIDFLIQAFQGERLNRHTDDNGFLVHSEVRIGSTILEVSEAKGEYPARPNTLHVFVEDTDACYRRALDAGARSLYEPADMPYGERSAGVEDAFGNYWYIATFTKGSGSGYY